jgi:predicted nucleic acid-binding protein
MKRVLVDVNVILDVLLDRKPHVNASSIVWAAVETARTEGILAAHAVTTIHYLIAKELGTKRANGLIARILQVFGVATVNAEVLRKATGLAWADFEDAVTAAAAEAAGCDLIVTRDSRGFLNSPVPALTPETAAALFAGA